MFTLVVLLGATVIYSNADDLTFSTQRDCMEAASAVVGVLPGRVTATCFNAAGEVVSINSRSG